MSAPNDGGPAFPGFVGINVYGNARPVISPGGKVMYEEYAPGLSMRDYFAAKAMQAQIGNNGLIEHWDEVPDLYESIASRAYRMADAMLAARQQQPEPASV